MASKPYEDGDPASKIIVLGQAPAKTEMRYGKPLVGPSGDVFKDCLHAAQLSRHDVYILNLWETEVWTSKKDDTIWTTNGGQLLWSKKGFTELGLELAQGALQRICASQATTIVPLGQQALELCTGISNRIMKWRGSPLIGLDRVGLRYVIPTVHPAATIHGVYLWRYLIISDLRKAKRQASSSRSLAPDLDILIQPTLEQTLNYIEECRKAGLLATDLEVVNHQVSCLSLSKHNREAVVPALMDEQGEVFTEDEEIVFWKAYADIMHDESVMKINQNLAGFDAPFLYMQNGIYVRGRIGDGMIAQNVLYPEFLKGLDFIASVHLDMTYWKDEGKMWKNEGGDFPTFWRYCGKDACAALESWEKLSVELTQRDMWFTYDATVEMLPALLFATLDGLAVDAARLEETKVKIEAEITLREKELASIADYPFNPLSPAQVKKYLYEHKGITPYKNAAGGITTDDKALSRIIRKHPELREPVLIQTLRGLKKLKATYLDVETDADGRLRCSWNPRGTWTGRLSSSQTIFGRGLNLQNLDPRFKGFIVEDDDGYMASCTSIAEAAEANKRQVA